MFRVRADSPPEPLTGRLVLHNDPNLDNAGFAGFWSAARDRATRTRDWYRRDTAQLRATITPQP